MIVAVVLVAILVLVVAMVIGVALDPGPQPGEVAIAYELAWDRLDFATLWDLSGPELRDGRTRKEYVVAKRQVYDAQPALRRLVEDVAADAVARSKRDAVVATRLELRDGGTVHNEVSLIRRHGHWQVVAYPLQAGTPHA